MVMPAMSVFEKAYSPMYVTVSGRLTWVREVQSRKALSPMAVTPAGRETLSSAVQP